MLLDDANFVEWKEETGLVPWTQPPELELGWFPAPMAASIVPGASSPAPVAPITTRGDKLDMPIRIGILLASIFLGMKVAKSKKSNLYGFGAFAAVNLGAGYVWNHFVKDKL